MSEEFCVLDVETTGLFPGGHDRVIEIALVATDQRGNAKQQWHSVINPERDIGDTSLHGIPARLAAHAPRFKDVIGDILEFVDGRCLVAHNAYFDRGFVEMELARAQFETPPLEFFCTMRASARLGLGRSLKECCKVAAIQNRAPHTALGDADATVQLLAYLLRASRERATPVPDLDFVRPVHLPHRPRPSGAGAPRTKLEEATRPEPYLSRVASLLPSEPGSGQPNSNAVLAYAELLDRVLEDHYVSDAEFVSLINLANEWGLDIQQIESIHDMYLAGLMKAALADGVITDSERDQLDFVAAALGRDAQFLRALEEAPPELDRVVIPSAGCEFDGMSVCFTGSSNCIVLGERLTRERAFEIAELAGLRVMKSVTKSLDILVVADPETQSGKAKKARAYGARIIAERSFWPKLGVMVD